MARKMKTGSVIVLDPPAEVDVYQIMGVRYHRTFFQAVADANQSGTVSAAVDADGGMRIVVVEDDGTTRPARSPRGTSGSEFFTAEEWFRFPLPLRERWWAETDYGKKAPGEDLLAEMRR